jgi:hypothetical protein
MIINRKEIYQKYNGHCAYCGCKILINRFEVDHLIAKRDGYKIDDDIDDVMNPAAGSRKCAECGRVYSVAILDAIEARTQARIAEAVKPWREALLGQLTQTRQACLATYGRPMTESTICASCTNGVCAAARALLDAQPGPASPCPTCEECGGRKWLDGTGFSGAESVPCPKCNPAGHKDD